jgi:hypothetical protein
MEKIYIARLQVRVAIRMLVFVPCPLILYRVLLFRYFKHVQPVAKRMIKELKCVGKWCCKDYEFMWNRLQHGKITYPETMIDTNRERKFPQIKLFVEDGSIYLLLSCRQYWANLSRENGFWTNKKMWQIILTCFDDSFHPPSPEKSDGGRCGDPNLVLSL